MPSARSGTAGPASEDRRWPRATSAPSNCARPTISLRWRFPRSPPASIVSRPIARRRIAVSSTVAALAAAPAVSQSFSAAFPARAPSCMRERWPNSAALVPICRRLNSAANRGGMHEFRPYVAAARLWRAADRGGPIGQGRRHLRSSARRAFQPAETRAGQRLSARPDRPGQDPRRDPPDPAARQASLSRISAFATSPPSSR